MIVVAGSGQYTTFAARMILLPVTLADGAKDAWPLIVVNPSLECVQLEHAGDGRWQVSPDRSLVQARLARPGPGLPLCIPADGLIARLTGSTVAVVLQMPPFAERHGVPIETIADLVGHASTAVTETVYTSSSR